MTTSKTPVKLLESEDFSSRFSQFKTFELRGDMTEIISRLEQAPLSTIPSEVGFYPAGCQAELEFPGNAPLESETLHQMEALIKKGFSGDFDKIQMTKKKKGKSFCLRITLGSPSIS